MKSSLFIKSTASAKTTLSLLLVALLLTATPALPSDAGAENDEAVTTPFVKLAELERAARARMGAASRVAPADSSTEALKGLSAGDPLESGRVPNYILVLAGQTHAAKEFATLMRAFLYGGTLQPETKMAMALRVAQQLDSPYAAAHASRWLRASRRGRASVGRRGRMRASRHRRRAPKARRAV